MKDNQLTDSDANGGLLYQGLATLALKFKTLLPKCM